MSGKRASPNRAPFISQPDGRPPPIGVGRPHDRTDSTARAARTNRERNQRAHEPFCRRQPAQAKKKTTAGRTAARATDGAGGGVILSDASEELRELVDLLGAPCTTTLMALGGLNASHPNYVGMPGMHGTYEANMSMQNSDVLICVGARFDDRVVANPKHFSQVQRKIIHIDVDPSSISKRVRADLPIVGNVKDVLQEMNAQLRELKADAQKPAKNIDAWWAQINQWRERNCLAYTQTDIIKPQFVVEKLWEVTEGKAFVSSDVGQHQMFAAQYYGFEEPRRWLNSGGLGTMGVGLPYAMGAQMANPDPDAMFACITGEGSIQMNIQELATCKQYGFTPKIICLNNGYLGMVRQWQELDYESRYSESYMSSIPDFVKLAESYGHVGIQVSKVADVEPALREAFLGEHKKRLVFLDFLTDRETNVWPMVKAGKGLTEMLIDGADA
ncbi:biosynthetic-type acetolactate synthase large subunit [Oligella ureolytica]